MARNTAGNVVVVYKTPATSTVVPGIVLGILDLIAVWKRVCKRRCASVWRKFLVSQCRWHVLFDRTVGMLGGSMLWYRCWQMLRVAWSVVRYAPVAR